MKDTTATLEEAVDTFREITAAPADGAATRARVLARAAAAPRHPRASGRRASRALAAAVVAVCSSAAVAWTVSGGSWRAPSRIALEATDGLLAFGVGSGRPSRTIPTTVPGSETALASQNDSEPRLYAQAHRAHFVGNDPATALGLWDTYLNAHPQGTFVPEARFNRALCLIRLSRFDEATRALRSFANGPFGVYRQHDASVLLEWLAVNRGSARDHDAASAKAASTPRF